MKIGLYTDPHISFTSSILPTYGEDRYSARLQMCIDSFKWMYDVFDEHSVDLICCCGDMTDRYSLRAEEITALSECLSATHGVPEIHIVGNHDMLNNKFYSTSILDNFSHITVYSSPTKVNDYISVLPYCKTDKVTHDLLKSIKNPILISHIDISGSHLRGDYIMDGGVSPDMLKMYFGTVFNGHLHTREVIAPGVTNIGSITSGSFSDNNSYIPGVTVYDTDSQRMDFINNPHAILFRKLTVPDNSTLIKELAELDDLYKYVLRVTIPYDCRDTAQEILSTKPMVLTYRIIADLSTKRSLTESHTKNLVTYEDSRIEVEMLKYLNDNAGSLKYPIDVYSSILNECKE